MRIRRKTLWGKIDKSGVLHFSLPELEDFCRNHPDKSCTIRVEILSKSPSERLTNYFFGYLVNEMQGAFYDNGEDYSKAQTYDEIRRRCPIFLEEKYDNGWKARLKDWDELDVAECVEVVAWAQRYCAENLHKVISDPE